MKIRSHAPWVSDSALRVHSRTRRRTRLRATAFPNRLPTETATRAASGPPSASRLRARSASKRSLCRSPRSITRRKSDCPCSRVTCRGRRSVECDLSGAVFSTPFYRSECACGAGIREPACGVAAWVDMSSSLSPPSTFAGSIAYIPRPQQVRPARGPVRVLPARFSPHALPHGKWCAREGIPPLARNP